MGQASWEAPSVPCDLAASPLYLSLRPQVPAACPRHPTSAFFLVGAFRDTRRNPAPKPEELETAQDSPEGIWYKRSLLGWLQAFPVVLPFLPSA